MITAETFLRAKGLYPDHVAYTKMRDSNNGFIDTLIKILDEYHNLKMEEAGFKKNDSQKNDTIKT